jgi:hypothetical protein
MLNLLNENEWQFFPEQIMCTSPIVFLEENKKAKE